MISISDNLVAELNAQVGRETGNSFLYRNFASWAHVRGLKNIEKFFLGESDGELGHAKIFKDLLDKANAEIAIPAIEQKPNGFTDCLQIGNLYVEAEAETTDHLQEIYDLCEKQEEIGVSNVLQQMLEEQVEEEGLADVFLNMVNESGGNLILLDLVIGER